MGYIYRLVSSGGVKEYETVEELRKDFNIIGWSPEDGSRREELWEQPILEGFVGPMYDGTKDGKAVIRYETPEVYELLSK